jgi:hypothetical protein
LSFTLHVSSCSISETKYPIFCPSSPHIHVYQPRVTSTAQKDITLELVAGRQLYGLGLGVDDQAAVEAGQEQKGGLALPLYWDYLAGREEIDDKEKRGGAPT